MDPTALPTATPYIGAASLSVFLVSALLKLYFDIRRDSRVKDMARAKDRLDMNAEYDDRVAKAVLDRDVTIDFLRDRVKRLEAEIRELRGER